MPPSQQGQCVRQLIIAVETCDLLDEILLAPDIDSTRRDDDLEVLSRVVHREPERGEDG